MRNHIKSPKSKVDQRGIVSIVVTVILMIVITLIVLSFAQISRREQRNALDRQLSTQAFYAAESGVNDAITTRKAWAASPDAAVRAKLANEYTTTCTGFANEAGYTPFPVILGGSGAASYTCVFVDPSVPEARFAASPSQQVLPIQLKGGGNVNNLDIYWDDGTTGTIWSGCPTPPTNPTSLTNCSAPVLRLEIVAASDLTASKVFFIYPTSTLGLGTIVYSPTATTGGTLQATCGAGGSFEKCKLAISGLTGNQYYIRLKGIYKDMAFTVKPSAIDAELVGIQTIIDVTGKATDVQRRIQVRVPANNLSNKVPLFGLEGTDKICKRFSIAGLIGADWFATDEGNCSPPGSFPD